MSNLVAQKVEQAVSILREREIDCWLTFVRETFDGGDPALPLIFDHSLTWQSALLLTRNGDAIAIVASHDAEAVEAEGVYGDVRGYMTSIREILAQTLGELDPKQIALNYSVDDVKADGLSHGMYLLLEDYLAPWKDRFTSAAPIISALRGRKTRAELERIRHAIGIAEGIFDAIGRHMELGMTELDIARFMREQAERQRLGLAWDPAMCPIVTTGPESMGGHALPSAELGVQRGCIVNLDFGIRRDGYCSDMQRSWYVLEQREQEPPESVKGAFRTIRAAIDAAAAALKPGARGWQIDAAARDIVTGAGYGEFDHGTGHQVGRSAHDGGATLAPRWERYGRTPDFEIEAGNVFTIEPSIADVDGRGYMALEEIVVVTEDGCEFLSTPQTELRVLAID